MTEEEYNAYQIDENKRTISVSDLSDQSDRTLVWGYELDRRSFHVYLKDGVIFRVIYGLDDLRRDWDVVSGPELDVVLLNPSKRAYPEACDAEFARLMLNRGLGLTFTTFQRERQPAQYHGDIL